MRRHTSGNTVTTSRNTDAVRITTPIHDTFLQQAQLEVRAQPLAEVVSEVVGGRMAPRLSRNQRAAHVWFTANGDLERRHTCGVYLRVARMRGGDPVLGVYVDSPSRVTDFRANKELYLSRLANAGLAVSDIDFRLTREGHRPAVSAGRVRQVPSPEYAMAAPPLSSGEEERVKTLTHELPEGLRQSAARAMEAALRREKKHKTQPST